ncbi:MAG: type II toxin-antitoxin system Phd/YefM family antitoxin [Oscillospiraceae bacterium]|nr:type II toxin-antitoxin system Phd/YefM family antitoxin [Oscillospiraceae bacterium]
MQIAMNSIIPITEATKHFKNVCDKTKELGTAFIFKNNRPDIVMMDIDRYQQLISVLDSIEHLEIASIINKRKSTDDGKRFSLDEVLN